MEAEIGILVFVCPATGLEVSTQVDADPESYVDLARTGEPINCPHCPKPHHLSEVQSWTVGPKALGVEN